MRLKWKIFLFLLGFCSLLLVILWLFQMVFLNDMYRLIRKQELKQAISVVENEIDNPALQAILFEIQVKNDILVSPTRDFIMPDRPGRENFGSRGNKPLEAITEVREFTRQNGHSVSMTFYALVAPVNATVTTLRYQLYLISAIMLLLAVGLALIIAKRVSKPIEKISQNALTLAKGDYHTHFDGKGFLEIVTLSDTLNAASVELGRVEALRRELMANVSHDLRTPLSLIYSHAEMMHDFPAEITPDQTQVVMDETRRLSALVNDLLDLSKIENDLESITSTHFSLTQCIEETAKRLAELLKNEGFDIRFIRDRDVFVNADETKMGRAFYNLLINAVNYSGDSRDIIVTQTMNEGRVRISITDHGEGIEEDDLPFIWDRYFKSGQSHKRAVIGTGLGLSIVRRIIELHGGTYGVTSKVEQGSTFWFELLID